MAAHEGYMDRYAALRSLVIECSRRSRAAGDRVQQAIKNAEAARGPAIHVEGVQEAGGDFWALAGLSRSSHFPDLAEQLPAPMHEEAPPGCAAPALCIQCFPPAMLPTSCSPLPISLASHLTPHHSALYYDQRWRWARRVGAACTEARGGTRRVRSSHTLQTSASHLLLRFPPAVIPTSHASHRPLTASHQPCFPPDTTPYRFVLVLVSITQRRSLHFKQHKSDCGHAVRRV